MRCRFSNLYIKIFRDIEMELLKCAMPSMCVMGSVIDGVYSFLFIKFNNSVTVFNGKLTEKGSR